MKTVLIVDDDESFLLSLIDGFKVYEKEFGIITANDGQEAIDIIEDQEINLILTDLKMPGMDGFELVAHLSSHHPEIPVIVMTAFGTPDMEDNLIEMGAFQYIEKPIDFAYMVTKIQKGLKGPSKGFITGVSLTSFLQLLELDKKTCTLTILSDPEKGYMYFRMGDLFDAACGNLTGKEAAFEIVSWSNVEIEISSTCKVTEQVITDSLGFILLEGSRLKDEKKEKGIKHSVTREISKTNLEDIDIDNLDFDLKNTPDIPGKIEPIAGPDIQPEPEPESAPEDTSHPLIAKLSKSLSATKGIQRFIIIAKDGTILSPTDNDNEQLGNFITYILMSCEQIQTAMGATGRKYVLLQLNNGNQLLALAGKEIGIGLEVISSAKPDVLAKSLTPALGRITLQ